MNDDNAPTDDAPTDELPTCRECGETAPSADAAFCPACGTDLDGDGYGVNRADDMSTDEIRAEAGDMLADADGAILLTANHVPEDEDGDEAITGAAVKFVDESLDDDLREHLHDSLVDGVLRVGMKHGDAKAIPVGGGEGIEALLGALASASNPFTPDEDEDDEGEGGEADAMFM